MYRDGRVDEPMDRGSIVIRPLGLALVALAAADPALSPIELDERPGSAAARYGAGRRDGLAEDQESISGLDLE
jgi:hypothetical protein